MKFTASIAAAILAFTANGQPFERRANVCNQQPAGTPATVPQPLANPAVANANACQVQCQGNPSCQSFVFGLPPSATAPRCILFPVPAAQVPNQGDDLHVFDRGCGADTVPTQAPTRNQPIGPTPTQGNNGQKPGQGAGNGQRGGAGRMVRRNVCGAAPAGPASNPATPFQTSLNVASQEACLALCKQTSGCQSVEFGRPSANAAPQCLLFKVPASQLPPPGNGQSFVAFDSGC